jgi:hypothetical protein
VEARDELLEAAGRSGLSVRPGAQRAGTLRPCGWSDLWWAVE